MKALLLRGVSSYLGIFLLIGNFNVLAQETVRSHSSQSVKIAQQPPIDCKIERNQLFQNPVAELSQKARQYADSGKTQQAGKVLIQALQAARNLENDEFKASFLEDIIGSQLQPRLLDQIVQQYIALGQKQQAAEVLSQTLQLTQTLDKNRSFLKSISLSAIARHYAAIGQPQKTRSLLSQSIPLISFIQGAEFKNVALTAIAQGYIDIGEQAPASKFLGQSLNFAKQLKNSSHQGENLGQIAIAYAKLGQYNPATQIAQSITNADYYKATALAAIANQYAKDGQFSNALQLVQDIDKTEIKASVLGEIAAQYAQAKQQQQASKVFSQALKTAQTLDKSNKSIVLAQVALQYAEAGQIDAALPVVQSIEDVYIKAKSLGAIALLYAKNGQQAPASQVLAQAFESVKAIPEEYNQSYVLQEIIRNSIKIGQYDYAVSAVQVAQNREDSFNKLETLRQIAFDAVDARQYDKALEVMQLIDKSFIDDRNKVLQKIAIAYASSGQYDKAIQITQQIENSDFTYTYRARTLAAIATQYSKAGQVQRATELFSQALKTANTLESPGEIAEAKGAVSLEYAKSGQQKKASQILSEALQLAQTIKDSSSYSLTLRTITDDYITAEQFDLAFQAAQAIKDTNERSPKLQEIANRYIEAGHYNAGLQIVNILKAPEDKVRVLLAIANKYIQTKQNNKVSPILAQAFQQAKTISGAESRVMVFRIETDSQGNIISKTEVDEPYDRGSLLEEIAIKYAQAGQYNKALQVSQAIKNTANRNLLNQRLACYKPIRS